jgi:hypothetical protein
MTLDEAILVVGNEVAKAPLNLTVDKFHSSIMSLVVRIRDDFFPMTVNEWRMRPDKPYVILLLQPGDCFGG